MDPVPVPQKLRLKSCMRSARKCHAESLYFLLSLSRPGGAREQVLRSAGVEPGSLRGKRNYGLATLIGCELRRGQLLTSGVDSVQLRRLAR